jgi:hypothetical protein
MGGEELEPVVAHELAHAYRGAAGIARYDGRENDDEAATMALAEQWGFSQSSRGREAARQAHDLRQHGLTPPQIATRLGITTQAVHQLLAQKER